METNMKIIDRFEHCETDVRTRRMVYPSRIVKTYGVVDQVENLLIEKPLQIGLNEQVTTVLRNFETGEKAGILLDFGVELHGALRILSFHSVRNKSPQVRISLGESALEALSHVGEKFACNDHSPRDMTVQIPELSDNEYMQTGFRFAYVELLSENCEISLKSIVAVFIYRDIPYLGSFVCDDELINKIYDTAAYTVHLNMQNQLWDGIKRDRLVWIGDMHPEMLTIRTIFGVQSIIEEGLQFIMEQTPKGQWMNGIPTYSMWWLIILYDWYQYTGNSDFMIRNLNYIKDLLNQLISLVKEDGSDCLPDYFLDWPTKNKSESIDGVRSVFSLALFMGANLSELLGDNQCAKQCREKQRLLQRKKVKPCNAKQTIAMCMLAGSMDQEEGTQLLVEDGAQGLSTFMSYYILKSIAMGGQTKQALQIMKEYYGGMLKRGATTFWEDFHMDWLNGSGRIDELPLKEEMDIHGDNGAFCYRGYRHSLCHGWASGPVPFLAEKVLGVEIMEAGCKKIKIQPDLGHLKWVKGTYPTPYGILYIEHKKGVDGTVHTTYQAPKEIKVLI